MGVFLLLIMPRQSSAQEKSALDSLYDELDQAFLDADLPPSLLQMADSLILLLDQDFHSIGILAGYMSNVITAGRDLGIDQHGFNTGLSYFHPSGMFADVSGFWNSEYDPTYYLTTVGIGYFQTIGKHWNISAGHDFMFYDSDIEFLFDKAARLSAFYQKEHWEAGLDYRYLYGREQAHRLVGLLSGRITFNDVAGMDRIALIPGITVQSGNATVQYYQQSETPLRDMYTIINNGDYPELTERDYLRLSYLIYKGYQFRAVQFLRDRGFSLGQIQQIITEYEENQLEYSDVFGLMNIGLSAAVSISKKNWNLYLNYTYNFPIALPGEDFEYPRNDYISISLMYTLLWAAR